MTFLNHKHLREFIILKTIKRYLEVSEISNKNEDIYEETKVSIKKNLISNIMINKTQISEIEIIPVKPKGGLIGFTSFVLDKKIYVSSIAIFTRLDGSYRLVYPSKKIGERNINIFYPIQVNTGKRIEQAITKKLNELFHENKNKQNQ